MLSIDKLIDLAIVEDVGSGDVTTEAVIPADLNGVAEIRAKEDLIVAGVGVAEKVFARIDSSLRWKTHSKDGEEVRAGDLIAELSGSVASILTGERIALNFLQHLSGVATLTSKFIFLAAGTKTKIVDTRKTLPGYRQLEKEAVKLGGGENHRLGLYDRYLIKDNHIAAAGSIREAVKRVNDTRQKGLLVEVEVKDLDQFKEALGLKVDIIMLDNFTPAMVRDVIKLAKGKVKLEVSGNISLKNIKDYAQTGVDYISIGAITHSAPAADIHMSVYGSDP